MLFRVIDYGTSKTDVNCVYLRHTNWDDWFKYSTLYLVEYVDRDGLSHNIGSTKIGKRGLLPSRNEPDLPVGVRTPNPPTKFTELPNDYFSLGQDTEFYERLTALGTDFREHTLRALRDIAFDPLIREWAEKEDVTRVSLFRSVPPVTVREQFNRLAHGGARTTPFDLGFDLDYAVGGIGPKISFEVAPDSVPPSNIHVVIGRNGVGKSHFLNHVAKMLTEGGQKRSSLERADYSIEGSADIANLVSVSFSAFDSFEPLSIPQDRSNLTYHYVGLKKRRSKITEGDSLKGPQALASEMTQSGRVCYEGSRKARWLRGLRLLEADPVFAAVGIADAIHGSADYDEALATIGPAFRRLSSGHKIVLLTITKLVETVEEKTLVLLDEPEAHLHPPLLSAFVRALSDLLINRNGVAIIATHSPVVLQEVPRDCAWKINRIGDRTTFERPKIETFGENVGTLTNEVFGLEVSATGFHKVLWNVAQEHADYETALAHFNGNLGTEGRAVLRAMTIALKAENVGS